MLLFFSLINNEVIDITKKTSSQKISYKAMVSSKNLNSFLKNKKEETEKIEEIEVK